MSYRVIALYEDSGKIIGVRAINNSSDDIKDLFMKNCINGDFSNFYVNSITDFGCLEHPMDRMPVISPDDEPIRNCDMYAVLVKTYHLLEDTDVKGSKARDSYVLCDYKGEITYKDTWEVLDLQKEGKLTNARVVVENRRYKIVGWITEIEEIIPEEMVREVKKLKSERRAEQVKDQDSIARNTVVKATLNIDRHVNKSSESGVGYLALLLLEDVPDFVRNLLIREEKRGGMLYNSNEVVWDKSKVSIMGCMCDTVYSSVQSIASVLHELLLDLTIDIYIFDADTEVNKTIDGKLIWRVGQLDTDKLTNNRFTKDEITALKEVAKDIPDIVFRNSYKDSGVTTVDFKKEIELIKAL